GRGPTAPRSGSTPTPDGRTGPSPVGHCRPRSAPEPEPIQTFAEPTHYASHSRAARVDPVHSIRDRGRTSPGADPGDHRGYRHRWRSEEHTSELQSRGQLVCRLLL